MAGDRSARGEGVSEMLIRCLRSAPSKPPARRLFLFYFLCIEPHARACMRKTEDLLSYTTDFLIIL